MKVSSRKWTGKRGEQHNQKSLTNLQFVDDTLLVILNDLNRGSLSLGVKMNRNNTKVKFNCNVLKKIIEEVKEVEEYLYF